MTDMLGITPPPPDLELTVEAARALQLDRMRVALYDARLNTLIVAGFVAAVGAALYIVGRREALTLADLSVMLWALVALTFGSILAAAGAWRAYLRMRKADEEQTIDEQSAQLLDGPRTAHVFGGSWISRRARPLLLVGTLLSLAFQVYMSYVPNGAPIVFRNATISTGTGFLKENMIVALKDGRVAFIGESGTSLPAGMSRARRLDAHGALISAATFDPNVAEPLAALRHIWMGQLDEGTPGNVVVTPVNSGRRRSMQAIPREILGAVVNGRYYSATELQKQ